MNPMDLITAVAFVKAAVDAVNLGAAKIARVDLTPLAKRATGLLAGELASLYFGVQALPPAHGLVTVTHPWVAAALNGLALWVYAMGGHDLMDRYLGGK